MPHHPKQATWLSKRFTVIASGMAHAVGKPVTFVACCLLVIVWAAAGPLFGFSDTWQLVINTSTTIVTFLMVFLIQNTQNRDGAAIQVKLDELIRATSGNERLIDIEDLTEEELEALRQRMAKRSHTSARKGATGSQGNTSD